MSNYFQSEDDLFIHVLLKNNCVCILKSFTTDWIPSKWDLDSLSFDTSGQTVSVKVGSPYKGGYVPKESDCSFEEWDLGKFIEFLKSYSSDSKFYYAGYAHFINLNKTEQNFRTFNWKWAGLSDQDSSNTTLWAGSKDSFTPCHKDSYGCNLHAQLIGSKEWLLWPPQFDLGPSRLPYEESSIFSNADVLERQYTDAAIRIVAHPGDVVFIPKHWWHLARNLDTSVSINTWIDLPCDSLDRLKESIVRLLVCGVKNNESSHKWKNPGEELSTFKENVSLLEQSLSSLNYKNVPLTEIKCPKSYNIIRKQSDGNIDIEKVPCKELSEACIAESENGSQMCESVVDSLLNCIVTNENTMNGIMNSLLKCQSKNNL